MKNATKYMTPLVALGLVLPLCAGPVQAGSIVSQVLKGTAVGYGVTRVAGPLDKFINTVTFRNHMQTRMATKVVPILSVGEKGYIGGAQVSGPAAAIGKVKAVFQYEKQVSNNNYRAKVLVASASLNPLKLERVPKVGVTAIIDVALDGAQGYKTIGTGIQAGDVIRGAAVLVLVKNTGPTINRALNTLTFNSGSGYSTRVVPMASVGEKMYVGAAQISASTRSVNTVNALWQYEDVFSDGRYRVRIMVPTTSANPLSMKRVDGAGVTAVIDMAVSEQKDIPAKTSRWGRVGDLIKTRAGRRNEDRDDERDDNPKHDNGLHKGWYIGKHKGWDKK